MKASEHFHRVAERFRQEAAWRRIGLTASVLLLLALGYLVFVLTLPAPDVWVTLAAKSESVAFTVVNPDMATFRAAGMRVVALDEDLNACIDAIVTPKAGARLEYRRGDRSFFRITIDPPATEASAAILRDRSTPGASRSPAGSLVLSADPDCAGIPPSRLPLWGAASFGEEARPAGPSGDLTPGVLTEGKLAVFARAHQKLLGLRFPAVIYPVTTFDVPAGSVLANPRSAASDIWTGLVMVEATRAGFEIQASSRTRRITLSSTRAFAVDGQSQQNIDIGRSAQFMSDPNVVQIQVLAGIFFFLAQSTVSVVGFFGRHLIKD